jgi:murein DD-endopeptidase MepM/ murein hydrolase activator NlpD
LVQQTLILAVAARSRIVRRAVVVLAVVIVTTFLSIITPLVMVPLAIAGAATTGPTVSGDWGYPLGGDYWKGRGFGWHPVQGCGYCSKNHRGYDMSQACGATIYAAARGRVLLAGPWGTFGNAVEIDHGGGIVTIYGHMMWDSLKVSEGMTVGTGTPLGLEGRTGAATGCHLHFEIRVNGVAVDPEIFMAARGLPLK